MEFAGPDAADFANVRVLNSAFLDIARADRLGRACLCRLDPKLSGRLRFLTENQANRLASTPFLLFSFQERDARIWEQLFRAAGSRDLFSARAAATDDFARLTAAGLGFVWQLAQRNPYAARVLAGASLHWCEQIGERTFFQLLAVAGERDDLLQLRLADDRDLWSKLLNAGVAREDRIWQCAQISALQAILTRDRNDHRQAWPTAARKIDRRRLRVAEESSDG